MKIQNICLAVTMLTLPLVAQQANPTPGCTATPAQLVASMKQLRAWVGNPSLADLNRRSGGHLPPSTISGVLRGEGLPRRDLVVRVGALFFSHDCHPGLRDAV